MSGGLSHVNGFLIDLEGTVYAAGRAIPGAREALAELAARYPKARRIALDLDVTAPERVVQGLDQLDVLLAGVAGSVQVAVMSTVCACALAAKTRRARKFAPWCR